MKSLTTILLSFALLLAFASSVWATETRVETMGMGPVYLYDMPLQSPNCIIMDEYNIGMYPSTINYFHNYFFAEINRMNDDSPSGYGFPGTFYKAGAIFKLGNERKPWYLGAHFSTMPYVHSMYNFSNFYWDDGATHKLTLYYGRMLGALPFGFTFGYYGSSNKNEDDDETSNFENSLTRYEIGFGLSALDSALDLAFQLNMTTWKDEYYSGAASEVIEDTKPAGNMDLILRGRYWMDPMGKYTVIPHAAFMMISEGLEEYDANGDMQYEDKLSVSVFDLGVGINYDASTDVLVAADAGVALVNAKYETTYDDPGLDDYEDKNNFRVMPYFRTGIDAYVFKWLDFRAGVVSACISYNNKWDEDDFDRTWSWNTTETFLGAGFHWGTFMIDLSIDPEFILEGPYFISGEDTDDAYDGWAAKASMTYWFD